MKKHRFLLFALVAECAWSHCASAHPGSGIVVDREGQVFFQDSAARTIWKIGVDGKVSAENDTIGGHWMALDQSGRFARAELKLVERITPAGKTPALIVADGGAPLAIGADGHLYYGAGISAGGEVVVGLMKISPDGRQQEFAPEFARTILDLGVTGLASGPNGTLYVACLTAVMKLTLDGKFTTLVNPIASKDCVEDAPTAFLRGLVVAADGTVYVAAAGCRSVLKITATGKVETLLKAEAPWSPTGVALFRDDVYVLEYTHANGGLYDGWLPRVRKRARDGRVSTLATITESQQRQQPNRQPLGPNRR